MANALQRLCHVCRVHSVNNANNSSLFAMVITKLLVNDYKQLRVNKYVSQALYQMLQTTKMNFEKLEG